MAATDSHHHKSAYMFKCVTFSFFLGDLLSGKARSKSVFLVESRRFSMATKICLFWIFGLIFGFCDISCHFGAKYSKIGVIVRNMSGKHEFGAKILNVAPIPLTYASFWGKGGAWSGGLGISGRFCHSWQGVGIQFFTNTDKVGVKSAGLGFFLVRET